MLFMLIKDLNNEITSSEEMLSQRGAIKNLTKRREK